ncbi:hypothetical protein [Fodinibius salsisoli]|uniref:HNH endonuclease n=1 Tax=Fodinibius salsisoli TaxID=2820877 RepID=A0ABT3PI95_9BACT|nr:hypothetical protein [Fodinibius salsisoli]MCW9705652.1 hypothetical protein [Fodinibius salsisoli]
MAEKPKRLEPKKDTLRELFLKSGNQCAHPDCKEVMMDDNGVFIGQLCHIEAALPGGERFNPDQSNEDRRHFDNLMLMCYTHHQVTNDVKEYPVERLKKIKATHEERYTNVEDKIFDSITDKTKKIDKKPPSDLSTISDSLNWNLKEEQLEVTERDIRDFFEVLSDVPENSRRVYTIMIERYEEDFFDYVVNPEELEEVTKTSSEELLKHIRILNRYDLTSMPYTNIDDKPEVEILKINGWGIPITLLEFAEKENIELSKLIVDLNFGLLG